MDNVKYISFSTGYEERLVGLYNENDSNVFEFFEKYTPLNVPFAEGRIVNKYNLVVPLNKSDTLTLIKPTKYGNNIATIISEMEYLDYCYFHGIERIEIDGEWLHIKMEAESG